ncbi:MAG: hypothetical protein ABI451_07585 [Dokdonella sp.]
MTSKRAGMLIRVQLAVLIVVACVAASSAAPNKNHTSEPTQAQASGSTEKTAVQDFPVSQNGKIETDNVSESGEDTEQNIEADRQIADETRNLATYTFWLTLATFLIFAVAIGQLGMFYMQLREMRDASGIADRTAKSAENTAKATLMQVRPWLKFEIRGAMPIVVEKGTIKGSFSLKIENAGLSPAIRVVTFARFMSEVILPAGLEEAARTAAGELGPDRWSRDIIFSGDKLEITMELAPGPFDSDRASNVFIICGVAYQFQTGDTKTHITAKMRRVYDNRARFLGPAPGEPDRIAIEHMSMGTINTFID